MIMNPREAPKKLKDNAQKHKIRLASLGLFFAGLAFDSAGYRSHEVSGNYSNSNQSVLFLDFEERIKKGETVHVIIETGTGNNQRERTEAIADQYGVLFQKFRNIPYARVHISNQNQLDVLKKMGVNVYEEQRYFPVGPQEPFFEVRNSAQVLYAPYAWNKGITGRGAVVAVLDGPIKLSHPYYDGNIENFSMCFSTPNKNGETLCPNNLSFAIGGKDIAGVCRKISECFHGTAVTSVVSAVAPDVRILPIVVTSVNEDGSIFNYSGDAMAAIDYIIDLSKSNNIDKPLAVNFSFGAEPQEDNTSPDRCKSLDPGLTSAFDALIESGIALTVPSGNSSRTNAVACPGGHYRGSINNSFEDGIITTAGIGSDMLISKTTNMGPQVHACALSEGVNVAFPPEGFAYVDGASFSSPAIAGVIGLFGQVFSEINPLEAEMKLMQYRNIIFDSRTDRNGINNGFNCSVPDMRKFVEEISTATPPYVDVPPTGTPVANSSSWYIIYMPFENRISY